MAFPVVLWGLGGVAAALLAKVVVDTGSDSSAARPDRPTTSKVSMPELGGSPRAVRDSFEKLSTYLRQYGIRANAKMARRFPTFHSDKTKRQELIDLCEVGLEESEFMLEIGTEIAAARALERKAERALMRLREVMDSPGCGGNGREDQG